MQPNQTYSNVLHYGSYSTQQSRFFMPGLAVVLPHDLSLNAKQRQTDPAQMFSADVGNIQLIVRCSNLKHLRLC